MNDRPAIDENICIVCGHHLRGHLDEGDWWRCHSVATPDLAQCECILLKNKGVFGEVSRDFYDMASRVSKVNKEFKEV